MPILLKISGLLLTGAGAFLVQNNPGEVRNNICAWDFVACPDWFDSAALNQVVFLFLMAVSSLFFLSLIIPLLAKNYRQTVTEIALFAPPKKPPEPPGALFDVIPRVAGNDAEICVRNLSMDTTLQDVEVSMPNYSETADVYIPEDIFRTLGSRDRLKCPLNINPGDQKYFRFASVTKKNGKESIRLHYDLKGQKYVTGDECVVKFRVSARDHRAQLLYQHVKIDSNGKLSLSAYRRKKDT